MDCVNHFRICLFMLLLLCLEKAYGIKCYLCQSGSNPSCGDVFTLTHGSDDVTGFCRTSCFKFVAARGDNREISRGCLPSNRIIPKCRTDKDGDIHGTFCACNEDFCNYVTSVHKSSICTTFTVFFMILNLFM